MLASCERVSALVAERNYGLPSLDPRPFSAPRPPAAPPPRASSPRLSGFRGDRPSAPAGAGGYSANPASEEAGRPRRAGGAARAAAGLGRISEETP